MVNLESEEGQLDPKGYPGSNPGRGAIQFNGVRISPALSNLNDAGLRLRTI